MNCHLLSLEMTCSLFDFQEMVQNAEDAGAKCMKIMYDNRRMEPEGKSTIKQYFKVRYSFYTIRYSWYNRKLKYYIEKSSVFRNTDCRRDHPPINNQDHGYSQC